MVSKPVASIVMESFSLNRDLARGSVPEFLELYRGRPIARNHLGMGFNHCFATWFILRTMQPKLVVESGVWRGQSTWLIEQAAPQAEIVAIDPRPESRVYTSRRARYETTDFARLDWSQADVGEAVVFFDDHQNTYERLKEMHWLGFRHAIFEDNYPCGEGDFYSLRHVRAGHGHPHIQMSPAYAGTPREALKRWLIEPLLRRLGPAQKVIVPPNESDRANLARRLETYVEFPAVVNADRNNWGGAWAGAYEPEPPLFASATELPAEAVKDDDTGYCHIAYVALRD
jgi:hypothetical protein